MPSKRPLKMGKDERLGTSLYGLFDRDGSGAIMLFEVSKTLEAEVRSGSFLADVQRALSGAQGDPLSSSSRLWTPLDE